MPGLYVSDNIDYSFWFTANPTQAQALTRIVYELYNHRGSLLFSKTFTDIPSLSVGPNEYKKIFTMASHGIGTGTVRIRFYEGRNLKATKTNKFTFDLGKWNALTLTEK